jgi:NitT/TauT family transport system permease protein
MLLAIIIAGWQYLPEVPWISKHVSVLSRFVISSPTAVCQTIWDLLLGHNNQPFVWLYLRNTVEATLIGTAIGVVIGTLFGLALADLQAVNRVLRPFIIAANSIPRIALVPVIVIVFGPTVRSSVVAAFLIVFFLVFFNAYEGANSVPAATIDRALIMGASRLQLMMIVRAPYAIAWTVAALPNAVAFGLVGVVTAELLMGTLGMGQLLLTSVNDLNASLTFAVVVLLSVLGIALVLLVDLVKRRWLHWWSATGSSRSTM